MEKSQQTEKVIAELYKLTRQFTKALIPRYYYQYRGDPNDLASEFFVQFMTPKASGDRPKESLLDKFDASITSLPYLVKVSVIRKLIDQSRQHPQIVESLDFALEDKGDNILFVANEYAEGQKKTIFKEGALVEKIKKEFNKLSEETRNQLFVELFDSDSTLVPFLEPAIRKIRNCPIQQVTNRTLVLFIPIAQSYVSFDVETGKPRGSFRPFNLNSEELAQVKQLVSYHSQFTKELLQEYFCKQN